MKTSDSSLDGFPGDASRRAEDKFRKLVYQVLADNEITDEETALLRNVRKSMGGDLSEESVNRIVREERFRCMAMEAVADGRVTEAEKSVMRSKAESLNIPLARATQILKEAKFLLDRTNKPAAAGPEARDSTRFKNVRRRCESCGQEDDPGDLGECDSCAADFWQYWCSVHEDVVTADGCAKCVADEEMLKKRVDEEEALKKRVDEEELPDDVPETVAKTGPTLYACPASTTALAVISLQFGIVSLIFPSWIFLGVIAVVLGLVAFGKITDVRRCLVEEEQLEPTDSVVMSRMTRCAMGGIWLGLISIVLGILVLLYRWLSG